MRSADGIGKTDLFPGPMNRLVHALTLPGKERLIRFLLGKRLDATDADIRTRSGLTLRVPSLREPIAFHLYCNGVYEPETIDAILAHLPQGGTFVDVGANIGAIALEIAVRRPAARVIAIEASPAIIPYLRQNIERNTLTNVTLVPVAASDRESEIDLYLPPAEKFGMASAAPQFDVAPVRVPAQPLDAILADLGITDVDVIKIDAEGAELDVLRGAHALLINVKQPTIIFEFADWAEARLHEAGGAQRELLELGYTLAYMDRPRKLLDAPIVTGGAMLLARQGTSSSGVNS